MSSEREPFQKEHSLSTISFSMVMLVFGGIYDVTMTLTKNMWSFSYMEPQPVLVFRITLQSKDHDSNVAAKWGRLFQVIMITPLPAHWNYLLIY